MHVTIVAYGTWGDVRPGIALSRSLQEHGYGVRLIVTEDFAAVVRNADLETAILPIDKYKLMRRVSSQTNPLKVAWAIRREIAPALLKAGRALLSMADETDAFIANHWMLPMTASIAEAHSLGLVWMLMQPRVRSREIPFSTWPPLPDWAPFRETYNLASYQVAQLFHWWTYAAIANELRRVDLDLPPWRRGDFADVRERTPAFTAVSRHVLPRPTDWAHHQRLTGFLFHEEKAWGPPPSLERFIDSGQPPVYLGFGSMHDPNPETTTKIVLEALKKVDRRAVLYSGWAGLGRMGVPDSVYRLGFTPHSWLFPRMSAVVHHAGAGTSAAALRAGVPSISIPHSGDQGFWARRLHQAGAGTVPLPRTRLNSADLADRIRAAVDESDLRERASELGELIRAEEGREAAVAAIKDFLS